MNWTLKGNEEGHAEFDKEVWTFYKENRKTQNILSAQEADHLAGLKELWGRVNCSGQD